MRVLVLVRVLVRVRLEGEGAFEVACACALEGEGAFEVVFALTFEVACAVKGEVEVEDEVEGEGERYQNSTFRGGLFRKQVILHNQFGPRQQALEPFRGDSFCRLGRQRQEEVIGVRLLQAGQQQVDLARALLGQGLSNNLSGTTRIVIMTGGQVFVQCQM